MRKYLPALALTLAVVVPAGLVATAVPAAASGGSATISLGTGAEITTPCLAIQLPSLPSLCSLKDFALTLPKATLDLALKLSVQLGVSLSIVLNGALKLALGLVAALPGELAALLSLSLTIGGGLVAGLLVALCL